MSILPLLGIFFIILLLMSMLAKARPMMKAGLPGKPLTTIRMNLLSRLWVFRSSLAALLTGLVFGSLSGWLTVNIAGMIAAFALVIVLLPMKLTLTTQGLGIGEGMFRPWSDFSGFRAKRSSLQLEQPSAFGRLTLFFAPSEIDQVTRLVERHVQIRTPNL